MLVNKKTLKSFNKNNFITGRIGEIQQTNFTIGYIKSKLDLF